MLERLIGKELAHRQQISVGALIGGLVMDMIEHQQLSVGKVLGGEFRVLRRDGVIAATADQPSPPLPK